MPMDPKRTADLVKQGVAFVCAACERFHEAQDASANDCTTYGGSGCGGPSAGLAFPKYKGPLNGHLKDVCYVCGHDSDVLIMMPEGSVGACLKHKDHALDYSLPGQPSLKVLGQKLHLRKG